MQGNERPLTPRQVAELFAVHPETVKAWARQGRLVGFQTPSGAWRFHQADVDAQLAATSGGAA